MGTLPCQGTDEAALNGGGGGGRKYVSILDTGENTNFLPPQYLPYFSDREF